MAEAEVTKSADKLENRTSELQPQCEKDEAELQNKENEQLAQNKDDELQLSAPGRYAFAGLASHILAQLYSGDEER